MRRSAARAGVYAVLIVFAIVFLFPIAWMFITALKSSTELASFDTVWWPTNPQWRNFSDAVEYVPFFGYLRNSAIIATIFSTLATLSSATVGYALARIQAPGRNRLFNLMISTLLINSLVTLLPTFVMFAKAGLVNTYLPWILWGLACPTYLAFMFRQFFAALPVELEEAAELDGCSRLRTFLTVAMPLARPALATAFILAFVGTWGDFVAPLLFLDNDTTTLAVAVAKGYVDPQGGTLTNLMSAGSLLYTIPAVLLFALMQRQIMQGIATSGLK